jgi:hypothetical protein
MQRPDQMQAHMFASFGNLLAALSVGFHVIVHDAGADAFQPESALCNACHPMFLKWQTELKGSLGEPALSRTRPEIGKTYRPYRSRNHVEKYKSEYFLQALASIDPVGAWYFKFLKFC